MIARPCLKWAGGKTKLLSEILPRLPKKIGTYYEPFLGGGAVFFALVAEGHRATNGPDAITRFERAVVGDTNEELMNVYAQIRDAAGTLLVYLDHDIKQDEKTYYQIRAQDPRSLPPTMRAARTIYLNKVGFNGIYRVNRKGAFNVPWGKQEGRALFDEANFLGCSLALQCATLVSFDFEKTVASAKKGDAVYFDSPYVPASETANFVAYTAGGFSENDQIRLRNVAKRLVDRGVHVLLSNSDTPLVRKLYTGFKVDRVEAPRRVNSKGDKRGNVGELLISGRE